MHLGCRCTLPSALCTLHLHLPTRPPQLLPQQLHHVRISLFFFFPSSLAVSHLLSPFPSLALRFYTYSVPSMQVGCPRLPLYCNVSAMQASFVLKACSCLTLNASLPVFSISIAVWLSRVFFSKAQVPYLEFTTLVWRRIGLFPSSILHSVETGRTTNSTLPALT
jgi:hypothetical protein